MDKLAPPDKQVTLQTLDKNYAVPWEEALKKLAKGIENDHKRTRAALENMSKDLQYLNAKMIQTSMQNELNKAEIKDLRSEINKRPRRNNLIDRLDKLEARTTQMSATMQYVMDHVEPPDYKQDDYDPIFSVEDLLKP